jgi:hypothetical protein
LQKILAPTPFKTKGALSRIAQNAEISYQTKWPDHHRRDQIDIFVFVIKILFFIIQPGRLRTKRFWVVIDYAKAS